MSWTWLYRVLLFTLNNQVQEMLKCLSTKTIGKMHSYLVRDHGEQTLNIDSIWIISTNENTPNWKTAYLMTWSRINVNRCLRFTGGDPHFLEVTTNVVRIHHKICSSSFRVQIFWIHVHCRNRQISVPL